MKPRRGLLFALLASLALHLAVLTAPHWRLPFFADTANTDIGERAPLIEARLAPPAPPLPAPRPVKQKRPPAPEKPLAAPVTGISSLPEPVLPEPPLDGPPNDLVAVEPLDPPTTDTETEVKVATPPAEIALPRNVWLRYRVTLGAAGLVIGETTQEWRHDGSTYTMTSSAETTGLARYFKPVRVINTSSGSIVNNRLQPTKFRSERGGADKTETALFDWQTGHATLFDGRDLPLVAGTQDMLSLFGQMPMMLGEFGQMSWPVLTGKKIEHYDFEGVGLETIQTPRGFLPTLHLRAVRPDSKETTDVWLSEREAWLPIKIRHLDRRGDVYEQIADVVKFDSETERPH